MKISHDAFVVRSKPFSMGIVSSELGGMTPNNVMAVSMSKGPLWSLVINFLFDFVPNTCTVLI